MNFSSFTNITTVHSHDADIRRRGANLIVLGLGMALLALTLSIITFIQADPGSPWLLLIGVALSFFGAVALGRQGYVNAGAWLLILITLIGTLSFLKDGATSLNAAGYLVLAVLLASVLLPPAQIWIVLALCLVGLPLTLSFGASAASLQMGKITGMASPLLLLVTVALIGFVSARATNIALGEARLAREHAEAASQSLQASNAALEQRVEERTAALRQIADEHRAAAAELQASLKAQHELNRLVADLAVPVIPVSAGTLVVPLVGNIDSARAGQILTAILTHVEQRRTSTVVLDVTGVALVDTHVAAALLRVAQATRLMGASTVLAGIRPEVAQALVGLGVDLSDLHTVATLQEALR